MYRLTNKQAGLSVQVAEQETVFMNLLKDTSKHKEVGPVYEQLKVNAKKLLDAYISNLNSLRVIKRTAKRREFLGNQIDDLERRMTEYNDAYQNYLAAVGSMLNQEDDIEVEPSVASSGVSKSSSTREMLRQQMEADLLALNAAANKKAIEDEAELKRRLAAEDLKLQQAQIIKDYAERALSVKSSRDGSRRSSKRSGTSKANKVPPKESADKHVTFSNPNTEQKRKIAPIIDQPGNSNYQQGWHASTFTDDVKPPILPAFEYDRSNTVPKSTFQPAFGNSVKREYNHNDNHSDVSQFLKAYSLNAPRDSFTVNNNVSTRNQFVKTSSPRDTEFDSNNPTTSRSNHLYEQSNDMFTGNRDTHQNDNLNFAKLFRNSLEKPPSVKFDGSLTSFYSFISVYEEDVLSKWGNTDPSYCLNYLLDSCTGQAYDAISACRLLKPKSAGLKAAISNLYSLYGNPERIERAHEQDVIDGDSVKDNFRSLSDYLIVLKNYDIVLQGTNNNKRYGNRVLACGIHDKLPTHLGRELNKCISDSSVPFPNIDIISLAIHTVQRQLNYHSTCIGEKIALSKKSKNTVAATTSGITKKFTRSTDINLGVISNNQKGKQKGKPKSDVKPTGSNTKAAADEHSSTEGKPATKPKKRLPCVLCKKPDCVLFKCNNFISLDIAARNKIINDNKFCANCCNAYNAYLK